VRGAGLPAVTSPALPVAAHACPSCGLSLSASARFCRRCGTPQQVADSPR
jgi:predicted amidophosphoribosyltransferase